jgi:FKBP-type peptidyl-prolyl cis-trans isomerase 2
MTYATEPGDRVRLQYRRVYGDGAANTAPHYRKSLTFIAGSGEVIPGISQAVVGMAKGDRKRLTLKPQDAFGEVRGELIREISRERFPAGLKLSVGKRLTALGVTSRRRRRLRIVKLGPTSVTVDSNHRLAGKTLEMEVRLVLLDRSSCRPSNPTHVRQGE